MTVARALVLALVAVLLLPAGSPAQTPPGTPANSADILKTFHTIRVRTGTWLSKPEMLQGALQKHPEFDQWGLTIVNTSDAEVVLTVDHQPGWFYYTYSMTHSASGIVLAAGKVTAWDGNAACNRVADEVIKRIKRVRAAPKS